MSSFVSPMQPIAPPAKNIRGGMNVDSVDAVRKRRQELDKLKAKQQLRAAQGLAQLKLPDVPPSRHPPPLGAPVDGEHHVDFFPAVNKVAELGLGPPPVKSHILAPPPRRLDQSFETRAASPSRVSSPSRAKSAPPSRPPPPPGLPPAAKEAPDSTPSREFASRPLPMTPIRSKAPAAKNSKPKPPPLASTRSISSTPTPFATPKEPRVPSNLVLAPRWPSGPPASLASQGNTPHLPGSARSTDCSLLPGSAPPTPPQPAPPPKAPFEPASAPDPAAEPEISEQERPHPIVPRTAMAPPVAPPPLEESSPPKPRQNLMRNMHEHAEAPTEPVAAYKQDSSKFESSLLRLEKEVRKHEKAKGEALRRVVELEEEVQKLKEQVAPNQIVVETPKASAAQFGFFSPLSPGSATTRANMHKRTATPHPTYCLPKTGGAPQDEEETKKMFSNAVQYTPFEFSTELATFIVRRPYGMASERELWFQAGSMHSKQYAETADVSKPESLDIVAKIGADGSLLSLHGRSDVRHRSADDDADWKELGNAVELDQPLGSVTYIDGDACEKDYSLDHVFSSAELARENYCTSVVSISVGLKAKAESTGGKKNKLTASANAVDNVVKKQTMEIVVGTEDLPFLDPAPPAHGFHPTNDDHPEQVQQEQLCLVLEEDEVSDTVSIFVGAFASLLLWILKTTLVTFPLSVICLVLALFLFSALFSLVSLQLADDNGAISMGAGIDNIFNRPGIV